MTFIRPAQPEGAAEIVEIYNQGIRARVATFQIQERRVEDIQTWFNDPFHPLLVAILEDSVVGWIHASSYHSTPWYAGIVEYSVYVTSSTHGQGVGLALMLEFLRRVKRWEFGKYSREFSRKHGFFGVVRQNGFS